ALMLVGGAVRDLLLGREPRELDVVVADGAAELAGVLAARFADGTKAEESSAASFHERFSTAAVSWRDGRIDIATCRSESYPEPGALPDVKGGTVEQDLRRRDFTVNAIAVQLAGARRAHLQTVAHSLEDLAARRLRVLHDASFIDDPTRLLRLARYEARLGFDVESHTAQLAQQALAGGALGTVSPARIGAELRLALGEANPLASLAAFDRLGILRTLHADMELDAALVERALLLLPDDGRPGALLLASLLRGVADAEEPGERSAEIVALLNGWEFAAGERDRISQSARHATSLTTSMAEAKRDSQLHATLSGKPAEAVALAGALAGSHSAAELAARRWFDSVRNVRLIIGGEDLLAAGIPAGPEVGRRLAAALAAKLDGELASDRDAELAAALGARA
ncbi:MAG TPA: hypothetical protein VII03_05235, partial [Solirubrobacteraceae bacterium]